MKKSTKAFSLLMSSLLLCGSMAACGVGGGGSAIVNDEKTINIKCRRAGFGTDWLYELKGQFETAFAEEGYKVNILTPDNSLNNDILIKELALGYNATKVDLYISSGATPDQVGELGDYGVLVEDIGECVYNQPAIAYDGTEEDKKIIDKVAPDVLPYMTDSLGNVYAYNWAQTSGGLVINTRKLANYELEIPKTTNEMFECFDVIYCGDEAKGIEGSVESGTYPITYVSGGNGYALCFLYTLIAQYDIDVFNKYWSFQEANEEGVMVNLTDDECFALYEDPAIYEMLKVAYRAFDATLSAPGSLAQGVDQAQAKIMGNVDDAVFMFNGDWMLNEVKLNYRTKLNDIDFCNFPVVSALGVKLFGEGTSYNMNEADCDDLLSYIIGLVDQNMDIADIIADVQANKGIALAEADAKEIARARGVSYSRGVEHVAYVTKGTTKKDIVSLFLRMMSSNDYGETFTRVANGTSPYYAQVNTLTEYDFVYHASLIPANQYFSLVSLSGGARGYRKELSLSQMFSTVSHVPDYISSTSRDSIYDERGGYKKDYDLSVYATAAQKLIAGELANVKKNWASLKENAGY